MNRVEVALNKTDVTETLSFGAEVWPVSCLFAGIVRAIAGQARLAQAAKFAAQRNSFYRALAAGGYLPEADATLDTSSALLVDQSSEQLLAVMSAR
jgi:hypothetical protein